jgi:mannose/cellobiose epimerase-like protein (N-acyl-D-glucosamine 2-epimerase family)
MQYRVIAVRQCFSQKGAIERLVKEVNEAIALGWEPQGGITVYGVQLMQAMIKRR